MLNFIKRRVSIVRALLLAVFAIAALSGFAYATSMQGDVGFVGPNRTPASYVNDQNGNPLAVGDLVQVIYTPSGVINPPQANGSPDPSETLLTTVAVGNDYVFGIFTGQAGMFYTSYQGTFTSGTPMVYVRTWNASTISSATYYGNSTLFAPETGVNPPNPSASKDYPATFNTNISYAPPSNTPAISSVSPVAGVAGTVVTLTGSSFGTSQGTGLVRFRLLPTGVTYTNASITTWSDTSISITVPSLAAGLYEVSVLNNGGKTGTWITFYYQIPYISSMSPTSGTAGVTQVTLTGYNFTGATTVHFDSALYLTANPTNVSDTSLKFVVPSNGPAGQSNVSVTNGFGTSNQVSFNITTTAPQITGVLGAPLYINTSVMTIDGTAFGASQGSSSVTVGGVGMTVTSWSNTAITGKVPNIAAAGSQNVIVTVGGVGSNAYSMLFYPYITSVAPTTQTAGSSVTLAGFGFGASQGTSQVFFNGATGSSFSSWSSTSIPVIVPALASSGPITVEVNGLMSNGVNLTINALTTALITSVSPAVYLGDSGVNINVVGVNTYFVTGTTTAISTGINVNSVTVTDNTHATVNITIPVAVGASANKRITLITGTELATADSTLGTSTPFTITAPTIASVTPANGTAGSVVTSTIAGTGSHFSATSTVAVSGGVTAEVVNPGTTTATSITVRFYVSSSAAAGARTVTISTVLGGSLGTENSTTGTFTVGAGGPGLSNFRYESDGGIMVAYPNPFNPRDSVNPLKMLYGLDAGQDAKIYIFDSNGRIIWQTDDYQEVHDRATIWDGKSSFGGTANNGYYIVRVVSGSTIVAKGKILVINR